MHSTLKTYEIEGSIVIRELIKSRDLPLSGCDMDLMEIPSNTPMGLHHHKTFDEVFYVVEGSGMRMDENGQYPIQRGDVFMALRGQKHAVFTKDSPVSVLTICLPYFDLNDVHYEEL
jgi:mannose-6-phosphate isomerase-like protein (cupin superfamily)